MLKRRRAAQNEDRLLMGRDYEDHSLVFARVDGTIWKQTSFDGQFRVVMKRGPSPKLRFHDLRHTHATRLIQNDVHIKTVSDRLGHATVAITLDTYAKVLKEMEQKAVNILEDIYGANLPS